MHNVISTSKLLATMLVVCNAWALHSANNSNDLASQPCDEISVMRCSTHRTSGSILVAQLLMQAKNNMSQEADANRAQWQNTSRRRPNKRMKDRGANHFDPERMGSKYRAQQRRDNFTKKLNP